MDGVDMRGWQELIQTQRTRQFASRTATRRRYAAYPKPCAKNKTASERDTQLQNASESREDPTSEETMEKKAKRDSGRHREYAVLKREDFCALASQVICGAELLQICMQSISAGMHVWIYVLGKAYNPREHLAIKLHMHLATRYFCGDCLRGRLCCHFLEHNADLGISWLASSKIVLV